MELPRIAIYTTSRCPYCVLAKRLLDAKGMSYEEIDVEQDDGLRAWLRDKTGQSTVPQIIVGDRSLGGFSDLDALNRAGRLDPILRGEILPSGAERGTSRGLVHQFFGGLLERLRS